MIVAYNILILVIFIFGWPLFIFSLVQSKRRTTILHRLGLAVTSTQRLSKNRSNITPPLKPIWIHALSVGEVLSAEPIVNGLIAAMPHMPVVFSASTATGYATACRMFAVKTKKVVYFPYDLPFSIRRIVRNIDPCLMVIVETDIWPNFLHFMKKRGVSVVMANAKLSDRSFRRYRLFRLFVTQMLMNIDMFLVQSTLDADRFRGLGVPKERIAVIGNVKFDQVEVDEPIAFGQQLRRDLAIAQASKIIVAGSTHSGEEAMLLNVFNRLKQTFNNLVIVLAPRDPGRAPAVIKLCDGLNLEAGLLSDLNRSEANGHKDTLIVDTIGILRRLYVVADIAFVGGSLVPFGGHNPLEPAVFAKPILFGPHTEDFSAVVDLLLAEQAAKCIADEEALFEILTQLLADETFRKTMGQRAHQVFETHQGATLRTIDMIRSLLVGDRGRS